MNKRKTKELVRDAIFIIAIIVLAIFNITARCNNKTDEKVVESTPLPTKVTTDITSTTNTTNSSTVISTTKTTASTQTTECSLTTSTLTNSSINTSTIVTTTICEVTEVEPQPIMVANLNRPNSDFCMNEPVKLQQDNTKIQNPVPETNVETTQISTITTTTEQITTVVETSIATTVTTTEIKNDITNDTYVYKPSTHFVHRMTCKWYDETCEIIDTTEGLNVLYCIDCNPDIEIFSYYQAVQPTVTDVSVAEIPVYSSVGDYDRELLAQIVWHEAGSDWISTYDKAMVAAGVMNRVNDSRFPSTVYDVLTQPGQFTGYWPDCCTPTQSCYDAVDYYFNNTSLFGNHNSWWGDGYQNHFYYQ